MKALSGEERKEVKDPKDDQSMQREVGKGPNGKEKRKMQKICVCRGDQRV